MEQYLLPNSLIKAIDQNLEGQRMPPSAIQATRVALITGITGQDGLYLTAYLMMAKRQLPFKYEVHGIVRKNSATLPLLVRIGEKCSQNGESQLKLHYGDVTDAQFIDRVIREIRPDEVYNLAAQSHVQHSFYMPGHTADVNYKGLLNICQAVVQTEGLQAKTRIFQASTSEMFGQAVLEKDISGQQQLMDENFPFNPASPYAVAKIAAYYLVRYYRNVFKLKISTGISFNHESPLRHESFITRKITKAVARIKNGLQSELLVGNLYAKRDWGHARDFVEAFWLICNQDSVVKGGREMFQDYVVATDTCYSVKDFLLKAFHKAGFSELKFAGQGLSEVLCSGPRVLVRVDPQFLRPGEVPHLLGNSSKIKKELGWHQSTQIDDLISEMFEYDMQLAYMEKSLLNNFAKL